jgi:ApaG protein
MAARKLGCRGADDCGSMPGSVLSWWYGNPYMAITLGIAVRVEPTYLEAHSSPGSFAVFLGLSGDDRESGTGNGATAEPALDDHQCARRIERGEGAGGGWGAADCSSRARAFNTRAARRSTRPWGMMGGSYQMETEGGERFDIEIPTFSLDSPNQGLVVN